MDGEVANVAAEAARAAFEMSVSASASGFSVSLKIDNPLLAGVALAGALSLGAFYLSRRYSVENAIRNALEERNDNGADPEVRNIEDGSIVVELYCHTDHSLLQFVDDFEREKVKQRLEKELTKVGYSRELDVTIRNAREVYKKVHEIRLSLSREGTHAEEERETQLQKIKLGYRRDEIKLRIFTQNLDAEEQGRPSHHFAADLNTFMKRNTFSPSIGLNVFLKHVKDVYKLSTKSLGFDCLEIRVECLTLESLERLWENYLSRCLDEFAKKYILTTEALEKLNLTVMKLTTIIEKEDYETCRKSFTERVKPSKEVTSSGAAVKLHEITVKITTHNIGSENRKKFNQNFVADVFLFVNYKTVSPTKGLGTFLKYLEDDYDLRIKALGFGCLGIGLECSSVEGLEYLWTDYKSGQLDGIAARCLVTDGVTNKAPRREVKLRTFIRDEEYVACKESFFERSKPLTTGASQENTSSRHTDHSKSQAEGNGLKEAEQGAEASFTITTRDSEGKQFYSEQERVTVTIRSPTGEEVAKTTDVENGYYKVHYKPKKLGRHNVTIEINGWPLTSSPWRVNVKPHQYKVVRPYGSFGRIEGEFIAPISIAKNEKTGEIAVADFVKYRVQVFDENLKYPRTIGGETGSQTGAAVKIGRPVSIAFLRNGDMIVIHGAFDLNEMSLITNEGQFIQQFSEHLINPRTVSVKADGNGHVVVLDEGDRKIKVLSSDGAHLLQFFRIPDFDIDVTCVCYHHDKVFLSYPLTHCVKVFNEKGEYEYSIGSEGSGEGQLMYPRGLAVDTFDNLIVCDSSNSRLQMFTQDGEFLRSFGKEIYAPLAITVCKNGDLLVTDNRQHCVVHLR